MHPQALSPGQLHELIEPHLIGRVLFAFDFDGTLVSALAAVVRYLLRLAAGVGRFSAIPGSLPALRNALSRTPSDSLADSSCLWNAETICHVAVHEHRDILLKDVRLRRATLDVLDRLVDAGSSLAFQLRDNLATSPPAPGLPDRIAVESVGMPADKAARSAKATQAGKAMAVAAMLATRCGARTPR